jgi:uncharacterized membrane protein
MKSSALSGILGALASLVGGLFAVISTRDYAQHLDRRLHGVTCSFVPGLGGAEPGENACTVAMYSPYSAVMKSTFWGGLPISLFALGAFAFLFAASLYFALARGQASRYARAGYLIATLAPVGASVTMLVISLTKIGDICKTCAGIYAASALVFLAGIFVVRGGAASPAPSDPDKTQVDPEPWHKHPDKNKPSASRGAPEGSWLAIAGLVLGLGVATLSPAVVYAATLPDYTGRILGCGKLAKPEAKKGVLVHVPTTTPLEPAISFEDPLCPSCKALHDRLKAGGQYEKLDLQVAIFPLDSECNWMLSRPLHPGACVLARAFLCADSSGKARSVLEWSYENQEALREAGKSDVALVRAKVKERFPELDACIDDKETKKRLDLVLQYAVENKVKVSTPQLYLTEQRVCDEDTDMGLSFALGKLAPKVAP